MKRCPINRLSSFFAKQLSVLLLLSFTSYSVDAQNSSGPNDSTAVAAVNRAIAVLGGMENWSQVGSASAEIDATLDDQPTFHATWSDDWRSGFNKYHRRNKDSEPEMTGDGQTRALHFPSGASKILPGQNDISVLTTGYPATSLMLSLNRPGCHILSRPASPGAPEDELSLIVRCADANYANGTINFYWTFSRSTGLPKKVDRPVREILHGHTLREEVTYLGFQSQSGLKIPTSVTIKHASGRVETIQIVSMTFNTSQQS
jgi:hypothetical protein